MTENSPEFKKEEISTVKRIPDRGVYDRDTIYKILDEAITCHVGFVDNGFPVVMPTIHVRIDDRLILHGSRASRMMNYAISGEKLCISVTFVDGLVLARSAFNHSMNYRSVAVFGTGSEIVDRDRKYAALTKLTDHVVPGRSAHARMPSEKELNATMVAEIPIEIASAKIRSGPPSDEANDYSLPIWAGVIPLRTEAMAPIPDDRLLEGVDVPEYALKYERPMQG